MIVYVYYLVQLDNVFFVVVYIIQKIGGNDISPNDLNVMVNYHHHIENRAITR